MPRVDETPKDYQMKDASLGVRVKVLHILVFRGFVIFLLHITSVLSCGHFGSLMPTHSPLLQVN